MITGKNAIPDSRVRNIISKGFPLTLVSLYVIGRLLIDLMTSVIVDVNEKIMNLMP